MGKYILKRVALIPIMLFFSSLIIFCLVNISPTDPALIILGTDATPEAAAQVRMELGLDKPLLIQYFNYIVNAVQGDLGTSYFTKNLVIDEILSRMPTTLKLTFGGIILAIIVGVPLGIVCAVKQYSWVDNIVTTVAMFFAAMPTFWLALLLVLFFAMQLKWFPVMGTNEGLRSFILPIVTVSLPYIGHYLRYTRSSMLDTIRQDYVITARAKGNTERTVILSHALRNALLPLVTITGLYIAGLMSSAVVVESVFALPGVGLLVLESIKKKDIPMILGCIIFLATIFLVITLIMDVLYAYLDPRIKAAYMKNQRRFGGGKTATKGGTTGASEESKKE